MPARSVLSVLSFIPRSSRDRTLVLAILAVALVIRVALVIATRHTYEPVNDAADFSLIATSIAHGHGFGATRVPGLHGPSAFRTPLWPALLGAVYWVVGVKMTIARIVLAVLGTLLVGLIGACTWILLGRRTGLVTMALAAVYPPLIMGGYGLNYEVLMGVMVFGALLCVLLWRSRTSSWGLLVAAGILSGLAVLCRENAGLVLIPICIFVFQALRPSRAVLGVVGRMAVVVACAVVVVVPWTIRNAEQLHSFVPVSDSPSIAIAGEYNPQSAALNAPWIPFGGTQDHRILAASTHDNEAQYAAKMQSAGLSYLGHHPLYVGKVVYFNTLRLFDLRGPTDSNWLAPLIPWPVHLIELSVVSFYVIALIGLYGLVTRRIHRIPWALWTFPVLWCLTIVVSSSIIQYRFVVEPFFLLLAAVTLVDVFSPTAPTPTPTKPFRTRRFPKPPGSSGRPTRRASTLLLLIAPIRPEAGTVRLRWVFQRRLRSPP